MCDKQACLLLKPDKCAETAEYSGWGLIRNSPSSSEHVPSFLNNNNYYRYSIQYNAIPSNLLSALKPFKT